MSVDEPGIQGLVRLGQKVVQVVGRSRAPRSPLPGRLRNGESWGEGREEGTGGLLWCPWREAVSIGWRPGGRPVRPAKPGGSWRDEEGG